MIKVLIADDSALMRKTFSEILESSGLIEVVGIARNGEDVLLKSRELHPDVITMDINMPVLDGITALQIIVKENICPVIIISALTGDGSKITLRALEIGAFDCIEKPGGLISRSLESIREDLIDKIIAAARYNVILKSKKESVVVEEPENAILGDIERNENENSFKAIAMGLSTGGPRTIHKIIPFLPSSLNACIFIVQHMPPHFTKPFAENLSKVTKLKVQEVSAGLEIEKGNIYVVKGGYQLNLYRKSNGKIITRLSSKPAHRFMPSIDIMMRVVLNIFEKNTIGVLMTGMGADGADGMVEIKKMGGYTIVESEETSIVFGMPKEAIKRGGASIVLPNNKIAKEIVKAVSI
jgi:two-component system, chemotaxis family, protein-glutamate methylesterase/glutaminase